MSTNGAVGFKIHGKYKVAYNHCDSYPSGLGNEVVLFIKDIIRNKGNKGIEKLINNVEKVEMVNQNDIAKIRHAVKYKQYADKSVDNGKINSYYVLLRKFQGIDGIKAIYKGILDLMIDSFYFLKNSLYCEYVYIINLDDRTIDLYEGFNKKAQKNNPLPFKQKPLKKFYSNGDLCLKYYPVRYRGSIPFNNIPDDWDKKFVK